MPLRTTSWGSCGWARAIWFCTSTAARSGFRETSKKADRFMTPSLEFADLKYSSPCMPDSCCSIGAATASATSCAVAPGYTAYLDLGRRERRIALDREPGEGEQAEQHDHDRDDGRENRPPDEQIADLRCVAHGPLLIRRGTAGGAISVLSCGPAAPLSRTGR